MDKTGNTSLWVPQPFKQKEREAVDYPNPHLIAFANGSLGLISNKFTPHEKEKKEEKEKEEEEDDGCLCCCTTDFCYSFILTAGVVLVVVFGR